MTKRLPLTDVKARLSEVVRNVRVTREPILVTVDGEPVASIGPVPAPLRDLTANEVATTRALLSAMRRIPRAAGAFDAVELVGEGRR